MAWWLFQNVVITAALAAVVALVCRTTAISPITRHALWVLVLVKFVTPPLVAWPWTMPDPLGLAMISTPAALSTALPDADQMSGIAAPMRQDGQVAAVASLESAPLVERTLPANAPIDPALVSWFVWLWAAGSIVVVVIEAVRLARVVRRVRHAPPADPAIARRVAVLSRQLDMEPLPVLAVAGGSSPAVWCFGRPRLLWPADMTATSTGTCIDGVLVHELAHVKRRDHLVGWIELSAAVVWWWNPLFWMVRTARREQAELACDAWVIATLPDGRRAYAESLLVLSGAIGSHVPSRSMAVIGIRAGSRRALERRLVMIMKSRASLRLSGATLLALAVIAGATLPAWATAQQPPPPPPPAPPVVRQQTPPPPPPPPVPVEVTRQKPAPPPPSAAPLPPQRRYVLEKSSAALPSEGRQLIDAFEAERETILQEADRRLIERRDATIKALQDLQDQFTKAGRLDEAVAIRDYLRAGGPRSGDSLFVTKDGKWLIRKR